MAGLVVIPIKHGPFWNFTYLVGCEETGEAAVIDPAWDAPAILATAARHGLRLRAALLTHSHSDHANALGGLVEATGASAFAHAREVADLAAHHAGPVASLADGETLELGRVALRAFHTPGHSPGSLSFEADGHLFCGDTLNIGSPGRPGPGPGAASDLFESLNRLATLSASTVIHPGHDEGPARSATLAEELLRNPAFGALGLAEFVAILERTTGYAHRH